MINETNINTQYKDRLFKLVFRDKKDLLQLYNAVNHTTYDNPEDIEVNTMELQMRRKNKHYICMMHSQKPAMARSFFPQMLRLTVEQLC